MQEHDAPLSARSKILSSQLMFRKRQSDTPRYANISSEKGKP